MAGVTIKYKNTTIGTLPNSGTKTCETAGTYCEDDITVEYVEPTVQTETKALTPTSVTGSFTASTGKYITSGTWDITEISMAQSKDLLVKKTTWYNILNYQNDYTGTQGYMGSNTGTKASNQTRNRGILYVPHDQANGKVYIAPYTTYDSYTFYQIVDNGVFISPNWVEDTSPAGTKIAEVTPGSAAKYLWVNCGSGKAGVVNYGDYIQINAASGGGVQKMHGTSSYYGTVTSVNTTTAGKYYTIILSDTYSQASGYYIVGTASITGKVVVNGVELTSTPVIIGSGIRTYRTSSTGAETFSSVPYYAAYYSGKLYILLKTQYIYIALTSTGTSTSIRIKPQGMVVLTNTSGSSITLTGGTISSASYSSYYYMKNPYVSSVSVYEYFSADQALTSAYTYKYGVYYINITFSTTPSLSGSLYCTSLTLD